MNALANGELFEQEAPSYTSSTFPPPREFQEKAHAALRAAYKEGHRRQLLMAPTGSGKTYLGMRAVHEALKKGKRAVFVCDRRTLINQTSQVADSYGLCDHGMIMANHWRVNPARPFQIASVQTLASRGWPEADLYVIDEAHCQYASWTEFALSTKAAVLGLTATAFSKGLGKIFTNLIHAATMHELTQSGVLVPMKVFSCTKVNMAGAATSGGEWTNTSAAERGMEIVGDVVAEWMKFGENRKTFAFGATIAHCEELCKQFNEAGVAAALYTADTKEDERLRLMEEFRKPDSAIRVLLSVDALIKGVDVADVSCICDVRPLRKSLSTVIQMWGRGLRSSPSTGKTDLRLLDFSGNAIRFADSFSDIYFNGLASLDDGEKQDSTIRKDDPEKPEPKACPECGFKPMGLRCIACGHQRVALATVEHLPGEMREIFIGKTKLADDRRHLYEQCVSYTRAHGNPETAKGLAAHLFREMVGTWPEGLSFERCPNVPITRAVLNRIKARNIAFSRSPRKAA